MSNIKPLEGAVETENGVSVNGVIVSPVVPQCASCERIREFDGKEYCSSYPNPARKWANGKCNFATHMKAEAAGSAKVNPLKASKRAARGR